MSRSVGYEDVKDGIDGESREFRKLRISYETFHNKNLELVDNPAPIPPVPHDLQSQCRGLCNISWYFFDPTDNWTVVEKANHLEIFPADASLPLYVKDVFGESAGNEVFLILDAISRYRRYYQRYELSSVSMCLKAGCDILFKNGNFYYKNDSFFMEPFCANPYAWIIDVYHKRINVDWSWPIE